jgi:hypothetical protein
MVEGEIDNSASSISRNTDSTSQKTASQDLIKALIKPQSQLINVQLDEDNFHLWKFQLETAIIAYGLEKYFLGALVTPPKIS